MQLTIEVKTIRYKNGYSMKPAAEDKKENRKAHSITRDSQILTHFDEAAHKGSLANGLIFKET